MTSVNVEIPDIVIENYENIQLVKNELQKCVIIWEYLNGHLSLRQCSELLEMRYRHFLELLWSKGIPIDGLSEEEVQNQVDWLYQHLTSEQG